MDYDFDQQDEETNLLRQKLNQLIEKGCSSDVNFLSDPIDNYYQQQSSDDMFDRSRPF